MSLESKVSQWSAVLVLLMVLFIVYFLFFHWFFVKHAEYNEGIAALNETRQKLINEAAKTPQLTELLQEVRQTVGSNNEFLQADSKNLGNAEITSIFKNIVNQQTPEPADCQIISQSPTQDRDPQQFEKIILSVRMRCQYEVLARIIEDLEANTPSLFVNDFRIEARNRNRYRRNSTDVPEPENLEVRFDLFAYLKIPVEKEDEK
jgi:general secretion pathway protein M